MRPCKAEEKSQELAKCKLIVRPNVRLKKKVKMRLDAWLI